MSRKTRKLIWSAPLVAVLAVAGALALFLALSPDGAQAQETETEMDPVLPGMVQSLTAVPHTDGTAQTELLVMWEEPTDGAPVTSYRIDISDDGDRWFSHVTDHGDGDLRLVYEGLKPTATKHFRVFALNEDLEAGPGTDTSGMTSASTAPMKPTSLMATDAAATGIVANTGALDLNGDGDATDTAVDKISEATVGVDLNGDGDIEDTLDEVDEKVAGLNLDATPGNTIVDTFDESSIMSRILPGDGAAHMRTVIRLNWTAPEDPPGAPVKYYRIQYRVGQGSWRTLVDKAAVATDTDGDKVWYHSGLRADVTRQYRVFAQNEPRGPGNSIGMSPPSDGDSGSTAASVAPAAPDALPVIGLSPAATDVHLRWGEPPDPAGDPVSHYRVQARMNTDDDTETWKNLHTGKHIDRTSVYNFGGVDLKNAGITVPQNILADGLVVDIRIAAINRANTDSTDAEIVEADGWRTVQGVPVGHKSAPKSAVTPTVKRDNEQHQGRSGLNVTWPKAEFIVDPLPADDVISYVLVVDDTELPNEIDHTPSLLLGGDLARPGYDDNGLATETTKTYHLYAINDTVNALVSTASVRSFPSGKASLETGRPTKPGAPGSFTVVPDGHTEIKVSWREPAKTPVTLDSECANTTPEASDDGSECGTSTVITGYKIQRAAVNSDGQPSRFTDLATVAKDKMSYTDADLEPGASFFYQVFTMNSQRSSDPTAQKSATTHPAGEPTPPGGLVAQADGHTAIKLCWYEQNVPNPEGQTDEGLPVIGYKVVYLGGADGETEMTLSENTMSKNTEFTASNLTPDTEYTFRVYSITLGGVGTKYDEASAMTADGPADTSLGDASGLTAARSTDGNMVMLEWTPGANSNIHWVAVARKNADGSYTGIASLWEQADMQSSHDSDVSALTAGTYVFTVIAGQYNASTDVENWGSQWVRPFAEVNLP